MAQKFGLVILLTAGAVLLCRCTPDTPQISGTAYFVACHKGNDAHPGTSVSQPWKSLEKVNATLFAPGDGIFFQRETACSGTLQPQGSGSAGKPITVGAYGSGPRPIIDGGKNEAAMLLSSQQYWHIQDLEITGGTVFGIHITGAGKGGILNHFRLTNLVVHDVYGGKVKAKESGLVVLSTGGENTTFNDVVVDDVTAYNTNQWGGIIIAGLAGDYKLDPPVLSTRVIVRNSIVHDVFGDGIVLWGVQDGLIEKSVAYETGKQPSPQTIGTPNAIWTWMCHDCIVQNNEAYRTHSPGKDGGAFDVDWGSQNNIYQYNYAHDTDSYCLSVFGAGGLTTSNTIIRYNICANNGLDTSKAANEGALYLSTWDRGDLDGVQIYNNTFTWNPAINAPLLNNQAAFSGTKPNFFMNNVIVSSVPWMIYTNSSISLDHNLYWYAGDKSPVLMYGTGVYKSFAEYQSGSQQDSHSRFADPQLNDSTYHAVGRPKTAFMPLPGSPVIDAGADVGHRGPDFFGNPVPSGATYDVGAGEWPVR